MRRTREQTHGHGEPAPMARAGACANGAEGAPSGLESSGRSWPGVMDNCPRSPGAVPGQFVRTPTLPTAPTRTAAMKHVANCHTLTAKPLKARAKKICVTVDYAKALGIPWVTVCIPATSGVSDRICVNSWDY
jgi:hypothetical protein